VDHVEERKSILTFTPGETPWVRYYPILTVYESKKHLKNILGLWKKLLIRMKDGK